MPGEIMERFSTGTVGFPMNKDTENRDLVVQAFIRNGYTVYMGTEKEGDSVILFIGIPESGGW